LPRLIDARSLPVGVNAEMTGWVRVMVLSRCACASRAPFG
jgi:hypothetical protein